MYQDLLAEAIRDAIISMRGDIRPRENHTSLNKKDEE